MPTPADVASYATLACVLEVSAPKPGNVSPGRPFRDTRYEDFLASAVAIGPVLSQAGQRSLGETIRDAVEATRRWTQANTNLGIILLLAPLARAMLLRADAGRRTGRPDRPAADSDLEQTLEQVLAATSVSDAALTYAAIRATRPGGLGSAGDQDLGQAPTVSLRQTMALAAERDAVASEYASRFAITFGIGLPALRTARTDGLDWAAVVVETYLALLATRSDTLIVRKLGPGPAEAVRARAAEIRQQGGTRTASGRAALEAFDVELRDHQNSRNPGTTADLTAAAIFVALAQDGWRLER